MGWGINMALADFNLGDIGNIFVNIREALTGEKIQDPVKMQELLLEFEKLEMAVKTGQIEINKIEASNSNIFVAGWRPFLGWVGGVSICYTFLISPMIEWVCKIKGLEVVPPTLDTTMLLNLVLAMLGFAGMRTYEKVKGVKTPIKD